MSSSSLCLSPCYLDILSIVSLYPCHLVTSSSSSYVTLSSCHLGILSSCHLVTLSSCHHAHSPSFSQALTTALHVMVVICVLLTLTTFRPSNHISIACGCIYLDAAPCHDAQNIKRMRLDHRAIKMAPKWLQMAPRWPQDSYNHVNHRPRALDVKSHPLLTEHPFLII